MKNIAHGHKPQSVIATMKLSLVFVVVLALFGAGSVQASPVRGSDELNAIFQEFLALVPVQKINEIFLEYLENDAEVQAVVEYVQSDAFRDLVKKIESIDDVINFYKYLHESGLDIYSLVNKMHETIGLPPLIPNGFDRNVRITGGVAGLIADIKNILPIDKITDLYYEKLNNSPAFAQLVKRLSSPRCQQLIDALRANKEFQKIVAYAANAGVNISHIKDLLTSIFGLKFPNSQTRGNRNLNDDLQDFIALVPIDKITEIVLDYMGSDSQVQDALVYMQSDAFKTLVQQVEAMEEVKGGLVYLEESGIEAYKLLNTLHDLVGLPPYKPTYLAKRSLTKATGGIAGLIADIEAILPIDDLRALYYEKLENSVDFANLIKRLSSQEFQDFVDAILAKDEVKVIINRLKEHNVDLQAIADLLGKMLGLHFPKPSMTRASNELNADFNDFLALIPVQEIIDIGVNYLMTDPDVQNAAMYIKTEEFKNLVTAAEYNQEFKDFLRYLDESGFDAVASINVVNDFLGISKIDPSTLRRTMRVGGGVRGLLDDIEAILPREKIIALYEYKKQNSKTFSHFIERLLAPEFQTIINKLSNNKDVQDLGYKAAEMGISIQYIVDFLQSMFGIHIPDDLIPHPTRSLENDFNDFAALIDVGAIKLVALKYAIFDQEVKALIAWVQSKQFVQLVEDLESIPEYQNIITILEENGVNVHYAIDKIKNLLGLPTNVDDRWFWETDGVAGLLKKIKNEVPVNDIKKLYKKKMETSQEFANFAKLVSSDEFQTLVDALFASDSFHDIVHKLQGHGINVTVIADFFFQFFGIDTPHEVIYFR